VFELICNLLLTLCVNMGLCTRPPLPLSEVQQHRLDFLASRAAVPYDPESEAHVAALRELWCLAFPSRPLPGLKCAEWKEMGWQGNDPATDFRSGGFLSLQNLAWFAANQPRVFQRLMAKQDGTRSEWEYPFAAAGVNITFQLVDMFELRGRSAARVPLGETPGSRVRSAPAPRLDGGGDGDGDGRVMGTEAGTGTGEGRDTVREAGAGSGTGTAGTEAAKAHVPPPASPAGAAFVHALASEDDAFERVYVAWFEVLDREWLAQRATYMEFSQVMAATKKSMSRALERAGRRKGGCTTTGLRQELGLQ